MASTRFPFDNTAAQLESITTTQGMEPQHMSGHYLLPTTMPTFVGWRNACLSELQEPVVCVNEYKNKVYDCHSSRYQETSNCQASSGSATPNDQLFWNTESFQSAQLRHLNLHAAPSPVSSRQFQMDGCWSVYSEPVFKEIYSTIPHVSSPNNVLQLTSRGKDHTSHSWPLARTQGILDSDSMETDINLYNAWRLLDANATEGSLLDSVFLPCGPGFADWITRFSPVSEESGCIHALDHFSLEETKQKNLNRLTTVQICSAVKPEDVQTIKVEPVHNLDDTQRWNANGCRILEMKTEQLNDHQFMSSRMVNNLYNHHQGGKMSQSTEGIDDQGAQFENCNGLNKKRKTSQDHRQPTRDLVPILKFKSQESESTEQDNEKIVKRCKASSGHEGKENDANNKSIKREQSCMNDTSTSSSAKRMEKASQIPPSTENVQPKQDFIHVRARRGQATDSHSLAERVRRERISERMKLLQSLVPNCSKVIGKALMLDEIINYVQSLQHQVEFLSMKLAAVSPRQDTNLENCFPSDLVVSSLMSATSSIVQMPELSNLLQNPFSQMPAGDQNVASAIDTVSPQDQVFDAGIPSRLMSYTERGW